MEKILAMREKRAALWEQAKAFLDEHTQEGSLLAEDAKAYEQMENEVLALGKDIERMERQTILNVELAKPTAAAITNMPGASLGKEQTGRASDAYRAAMLKALRTNFRQVENVLQEGTDASGGYLVPEEYDKRLIDVLSEENVLRSLATTITTSGEHKINIAATKPAASWIEEGAPLTFGDATFDQIVFDAHKLHVAVEVTASSTVSSVLIAGMGLPRQRPDACKHPQAQGQQRRLSVLRIRWATPTVCSAIPSTPQHICRQLRQGRSHSLSATMPTTISAIAARALCRNSRSFSQGTAWWPTL